MKERLKITKERLLLALILILSGILNFANISIEGYANTFYAAGVKSMMMNLKNFFFASFDPAGFVSIDKPPVGFWIQTIFAKIFGFHGWSIIMPQAIAGVAAVYVIYILVKHSFGGTAGLIAALSLAITPIFVAASRNNTIDNLLVLTLVLACYNVLIAAEKGKVKYLIFSLIIVGVGFNIKMVEAYMVAPALYVTYLFSAVLPIKKKIKHLFLGTIVLLVVSLSWAIVTDLVPTSERPYVGSSTNNSVIQLIIGHNGLQRIGINTNSNASKKSDDKNRLASDKFSFGNGEYINSKSTSKNYRKNVKRESSGITIFKLFENNSMSDQISWLLLFSIVGFVVSAIMEKFKIPFDNNKKLALLLWIVWLMTEFIYFTFSKNVTHTYYLTTMAPAIAALTGIGLVSMYSWFKEETGIKKYVLPFTIIANAAVEVLMLSYHFDSKNYEIVIAITLILAVIGSLALIIVMGESLKISKTIICIAFTGILVAPTVWSFTPMFNEMNGSSPSAGLELISNNSKEKNNSINNNNNTKLVQFLEEHNTNEKYFVEVPSATIYGSDLILETGKPILTLGGFSGSDPILTLKQFKKLVSKGEVRYAITSEGSLNYGISSKNSNTKIMNWIRKNGKLVPNSQWESAVTNFNGSINSQFGKLSGFKNRGNDLKLYDLGDLK